MHSDKGHSAFGDCKYDAILVLGGGIKSNRDLPLWVKLRLNRVLEYGMNIPVLTLSAGTTHKSPLLDETGRPVVEAVVMGQYLESRGYRRGLLWPEASSYDTIGNAYFARTVHTDPAGLRRLLVITSMFHSQRTKILFEWIFSLGAPTQRYCLDFVFTPDTGMHIDVLNARLDKEQKRLSCLRELINRCNTMEGLHRWLFTEHEAYALSARNMVHRDIASRELLDSY